MPAASKLSATLERARRQVRTARKQIEKDQAQWEELIKRARQLLEVTKDACWDVIQAQEKVDQACSLISLSVQMEQIEKRYGDVSMMPWTAAPPPNELLALIPTMVSSLIKANKINCLDQALKGKYEVKPVKASEKIFEPLPKSKAIILGGSRKMYNCRTSATEFTIPPPPPLMSSRPGNSSSAVETTVTGPKLPAKRPIISSSDDELTSITSDDSDLDLIISEKIHKKPRLLEESEGIKSLFTPTAPAQSSSSKVELTALLAPSSFNLRSSRRLSKESTPLDSSTSKIT